MTDKITITCAPCCWGVDDVNNPHLPSWEQVLDEASEAGFGGLELGPYGYVPLDVAQVLSSKTTTHSRAEAHVGRGRRGTHG